MRAADADPRCLATMRAHPSVPWTDRMNDGEQGQVQSAWQRMRSSIASVAVHVLIVAIMSGVLLSLSS